LATISSKMNLYRKFSWVRQIHTLGPNGTNCELAALHWRDDKMCVDTTIFLHDSFELAAEAVAVRNDSVLLGVAAYPQLHSIIYSNLKNFQIIDVFICRTEEMILASNDGYMPSLCATHPAPERLLPSVIERKYVSNNVAAAQECASGNTDGCLTTLRAAKKYNLKIVNNFGQVPMAFTVHGSIQHALCEVAGVLDKRTDYNGYANILI
jgi:hypothetical protein